MSNAQTIARNTGLIFIGELTTRALAFALVVVIARHLGGIGLGAYSFAFAFTDLLLNVADMGIPIYMARRIGRNRSETQACLSSVLGIRTALLPLILIAGVAFAYATGATTETRTIILLATAGMALNFLADPFRAVFMAHERNAYYSAILIAERLIFTITGIALLAAGKGLVPVMLAYIASQLVAVAANAYFVRRGFSAFTIKLDRQQASAILKGAAPIWAANFLRMVYQRADALMLSAMKGFEATGLYSSAYKITEALTVVPLALIGATLPAMSKFFSTSSQSLKVLYEKSFYYLLLLALPMAAGLTLTADRIILFLYGPQFSAAAAALIMLAWAEALLFLHLIMGFLLTAIDRQGLFTAATAAYAAANVAINLVLIPRYGAAGAAAAALATQAIAVAILYTFCSKNGYAINLPRIIWKPAAATAAMAATMILMSNLHLMATVPAAAATYVAALVLLKGIGKEDAKLLMNVVLNRP